MARDNPSKRQKVSVSGEKFGLRKHGNSRKRFMSIVPDDLLVEILLRLPNARSVLQCTVVCKLWYSLILSPEFSFRRRFIEYHHLLKPSFDPSYLPDHTFAFFFKFSAFASARSYQLSSNSILKPKQYWPSFIPTSTKLAIRASSGDLMLLSDGVRRYYICNSLTRRWLLLPEIPPFEHRLGPYRGQPGFALVRYPSNTDPQLGRYRVVFLRRAHFVRTRLVCSVFIFDSDTGLWTHLQPYVPFNSPWRSIVIPIQPDVVVASNGVLCWMEGDYGCYYGMASLNPFTLELRLTPFPAGYGLRRKNLKHKVHTGVVRGRVRFSKMVELESKVRFGLRVWELDYGDDRWELVHNIELQADGASFLFLLAFDPNDGDAIFVVRDWKIFRYEIGQQKFVKICRFPHGRILSRKKLKKKICRYLKVWPLVHPLWPTSLPSGSE